MVMGSRSKSCGCVVCTVMTPKKRVLRLLTSYLCCPAMPPLQQARSSPFGGLAACPFDDRPLMQPGQDGRDYTVRGAFPRTGSVSMGRMGSTGFGRAGSTASDFSKSSVWGKDGPDRQMSIKSSGKTGDDRQPCCCCAKEGSRSP